MKRTSLYLYAGQLDALAALQAETGIPVARLIRDGIDRELVARGVKVAGWIPRRGNR